MFWVRAARCWRLHAPPHPTPPLPLVQQGHDRRHSAGGAGVHGCAVLRAGPLLVHRRAGDGGGGSQILRRKVRGEQRLGAAVAAVGCSCGLQASWQGSIQSSKIWLQKLPAFVRRIPWCRHLGERTLQAALGVLAAAVEGVGGGHRHAQAVHVCARGIRSFIWWPGSVQHTLTRKHTHQQQTRHLKPLSCVCVTILPASPCFPLQADVFRCVERVLGGREAGEATRLGCANVLRALGACGGAFLWANSLSGERERRRWQWRVGEGRGCGTDVGKQTLVCTPSCPKAIALKPPCATSCAGFEAAKALCLACLEDGSAAVRAAFAQALGAIAVAASSGVCVQQKVC